MLKLKEWRRRRILKRSRIPEHAWSDGFARIPVLGRLCDDERARLRELAVLFLHEKVFEAARGLSMTDTMRVAVALQACLPILNLGLDWYSGWVSVILYPAGFVPGHEYTDDAGVVHQTRHALSGESWLRGPVILSWPDVLPADTGGGYNVVIHEFAHKLDMLDGAANGIPPLHGDMNVDAWAETFSQAYLDLQNQVERGEKTSIDAYGAQDPGEFFAVLSEVFFERPLLLEQSYPDVYRLLTEFYRQDPAARN